METGPTTFVGRVIRLFRLPISKGRVNVRMKRYLSIAAAVLLLAPVSLQATTVERMGVDELARNSQLIVLGTVVKNEIVYDEGPEGPMNVRTLTTVQVDYAFKGQAGATVEVLGFGGRVGNLVHNWPGIPRFEVGEEAILFLAQLPGGPHAGKLVVTGLEQGRLTVVEKPGKGTMVEQHLSTLHFDTANIHAPAEQSFADVVGQIEHVVETQRNAEQGR